MQKLLDRLKFDSLIKYGIAAILIAVPLYPKFPFLNIPGTYVSVRLEDFLIMVVSIIWGISIIPRIKYVFKDKVNIAIFLFFAVSLVSTISGILLTQTVVAHIGLLHWLRRVEYLIGFFIASTTLRSEKDLIFYIKSIALVVVVVFVYGWGQKYYTWPVITTQNDQFSQGIALRYMPGGHLVSTFAGHYDLASFVILVAPIFVALLFASKESLREVLKDKRLVITKGALIALILMSFWLVANTASRISSMSFLISLSLALIFVRKVRLIPIVVILGFLFFFLTSNLVGRYLEIFNVVVKKVTGQVHIVKDAYAQERRLNALTPTPTPIPVLQDLSTSIRLNVEWPRALRAFEKNPLLGTGFSSITLATDNDYLRTIGELGALGFASLMLLLFRIVRGLIKRLPIPKTIDIKSAYMVGIIAALPGVFINAVFIDIFEASKFAIMFWILVGFCFSNFERK
ncbi:MAG TPA: O-antigen ligase family protein [Patescibacteria group bacterium]